MIDTTEGVVLVALLIGVIGSLLIRNARMLRSMQEFMGAVSKTVREYPEHLEREAEKHGRELEEMRAHAAYFSKQAEIFKIEAEQLTNELRLLKVVAESSAKAADNWMKACQHNARPSTEEAVCKKLG